MEKAFTKKLYIPDYPKTPEEKRLCELAKAATDFAAYVSHGYNLLKKMKAK